MPGKTDETPKSAWLKSLQDELQPACQGKSLRIILVYRAADAPRIVLPEGVRAVGGPILIIEHLYLTATTSSGPALAAVLERLDRSDPRPLLVSPDGEVRLLRGNGGTHP